MVSKLQGLVVLSLVALFSIGCGGLSKEEAMTRCNQEKAAKGFQFGPDSYAQCVQCFQDCGDDCQALPVAPAEYKCPGEEGDTTGGSTTGGGGAQ